MPGRLRIADVNQDGFTDLVMTLSFKNTTSTTPAYFTRSIILLNEESDNGKRSLAQVKSSDDSYLAKVVQMAGDSAELLSFMDIDDDGKLDFVLQKKV